MTCLVGAGACCNPVAGPLGPNGISTNSVAYGDCRCADCTWFESRPCQDVIAAGACEADLVAVPAISEWGAVIITLALLIGACWATASGCAGNRTSCRGRSRAG